MIRAVDARRNVSTKVFSSVAKMLKPVRVLVVTLRKIVLDQKPVFVPSILTPSGFRTGHVRVRSGSVAHER